MAGYAATYAGLRVSLAQARMRWRKGLPYSDHAIAPLTGLDPLLVETADRNTPLSLRRQELRNERAHAGEHEIA
jgi:hypothetical protein